MDFYEFGARIAVLYIPLLLSLTIHEYAHGLVAKWKGDNTADYRGRLTLNPVSHMDMVGTFILPLTMIFFNAGIIGWGVPVPVDERNMKNPKVDMFWVAFAGPISNVILAILSSLVFGVIATHFADTKYSSGVEAVCYALIKMNLVLALFNLIPIHPLDGGKVLARFLPDHINQKLEENQTIMGVILMVLLLSGLLTFIFTPVDKLTLYLVGFAQMLVR
jgi:Zn-dependent protease